MNVLTPASEEDVARLRGACARQYKVDEAAVQVVFAPYRLCPLGAHIDHQHGPVSAIAASHGIHMAFTPSDNIKLTSVGYANTIEVQLDSPQRRHYDWGDYARGAAQALNKQFTLRRGMSMLIDGRLSEAGISSSAAVGLGYLLALAQVNDLQLPAAQLIELDRQIENDFLGLKNGVLDQSAIALARKHELTLIDCKTHTHQHIVQQDKFEFLAVYSGLKEPLIDSNKFNRRVEECLETGARLHHIEFGETVRGMPLGDVGRNIWEMHQSRLDALQQRRAQHFFSESQRVLDGAQAWEANDRHRFGQLMNASCESSINSYETGSPQLIRLFHILAETSGVYGARFSGAGFRGCAVALVSSADVEQIVARVEDAYRQHYPELIAAMWAIRTKACNGLRML